jgi:hypothetical protein
MGNSLHCCRDDGSGKKAVKQHKIHNNIAGRSLLVRWTDGCKALADLKSRAGFLGSLPQSRREAGDPQPLVEAVLDGYVSAAEYKLQFSLMPSIGKQLALNVLSMLYVASKAAPFVTHAASLHHCHAAKEMNRWILHGRSATITLFDKKKAGPAQDADNTTARFRVLLDDWCMTSMAGGALPDRGGPSVDANASEPGRDPGGPQAACSRDSIVRRNTQLLPGFVAAFAAVGQRQNRASLAQQQIIFVVLAHACEIASECEHVMRETADMSVSQDVLVDETADGSIERRQRFFRDTKVRPFLSPQAYDACMF